MKLLIFPLLILFGAAALGHYNSEKSPELRVLLNAHKDDAAAQYFIKHSGSFRNLVMVAADLRKATVTLEPLNPLSVSLTGPSEGNDHRGCSRYAVLVKKSTWPSPVRIREVICSPRDGKILSKDTSGAWVPEGAHSTWGYDCAYNAEWFEAMDEHFKNIAPAPTTSQDSRTTTSASAGRPLPPFGPDREKDVLALLNLLKPDMGSNHRYAGKYLSDPATLSSSDGIAHAPFPVPCWVMWGWFVDGNLCRPSRFAIVVTRDGRLFEIDQEGFDRGDVTAFIELDANGKRFPGSAGSGSGGSSGIKPPDAGSLEECKVCKGEGTMRRVVMEYENLYITRTPAQQRELEERMRALCPHCGGRRLVRR